MVGEVVPCGSRRVEHCDGAAVRGREWDRDVGGTYGDSDSNCCWLLLRVVVVVLVAAAKDTSSSGDGSALQQTDCGLSRRLLRRGKTASRVAFQSLLLRSRNRSSNSNT